MDIFEAMFCCFTCTDKASPANSKIPTEKIADDHYTIGRVPRQSINSRYTDDSDKEIANNILIRLYAAENLKEFHEELRTTSWTETIARHLLDGLVAALKAGKSMGGVMQEAYDKVTPQVEKFIDEHPILTAVILTLVALCILAYAVPWAITALGFGELGPVEGKDFFCCWVLDVGDLANC